MADIQKMAKIQTGTIDFKALDVAIDWTNETIQNARDKKRPKMNLYISAINSEHVIFQRNYKKEEIGMYINARTWQVNALVTTWDEFFHFINDRDITNEEEYAMLNKTYILYMRFLRNAYRNAIV